MEGFASGGDVNKLRCGAGEGGIQMQCRGQMAGKESGEPRGLERREALQGHAGSHHNQHLEMTAGYSCLK